MDRELEYYDGYINSVNYYTTKNQGIRGNQSLPITLFHQELDQVVQKHKVKTYSQPTQYANITKYTKIVNCPTFESNLVQQSISFDNIYGSGFLVNGNLSVICPVIPLIGDSFTTHSDKLHVFEITGVQKTNINDLFNLYEITYKKKHIISLVDFNASWDVINELFFAKELNGFLDIDTYSIYTELYTEIYETMLVVNSYEENDITDSTIRYISQQTSTYNLRYVDIQDIELSELNEPGLIDYPLLEKLLTLEKWRNRGN